MRTLLVAQPWASLIARGECRFLTRTWADAYRGTVAIQATSAVDNEAIERLSSDVEFAERLRAAGLGSASDCDALPRSAIVGVAVIADLWSLESLEEIATEDDAVLLGDVASSSVFWELAEAVEIPAVAIVEPAEPVADADAEAASDDDDADDETDETDEDVGIDAQRDLEPVDDTVAAQVRDAVSAAGALFDDDGLVFWPVHPSPALAELIGDDALGDRDITQRVWAYVVEHDLQDAEDHSYVYLDDTLRDVLGTDADGVPTVEFTDLVVAQMVRPTRARD